MVLPRERTRPGRAQLRSTGRWDRRSPALTGTALGKRNWEQLENLDQGDCEFPSNIRILLPPCRAATEGEAGKEGSNSYRLSWPEHKHLTQPDAGVAAAVGSRHSQVRVTSRRVQRCPKYSIKTVYSGIATMFTSKTFPWQMWVEKLGVETHQSLSHSVFANVLNFIISLV